MTPSRRHLRHPFTACTAVCLAIASAVSCGGGDDSPSGDGDGDSTGGTDDGSSGGSPGSGATTSGGNGGDHPGGGGDVTVASGQNEPTGIAVNATDVFWANRGDGTILRCPLAGCGNDAPEEVVSELVAPTGITLSATHIYWMDRADETDPGTVLKGCPLPKCAGGPVLIGDIYDFNSFESDVHFSNDLLYVGSWPVFGSCDPGDCLTEGLTSFDGGPVVSVDTNDDYLYSSRNGWGSIYRCTLPDCTDPLAIVTIPSPIGLAVTNDEMYFSHQVELNLGGAGGENSGLALFKCPADGCDLADATVVKTGDISPYSIAISGDRLFFTNSIQGTVLSIPR